MNEGDEMKQTVGFTTPLEEHWKSKTLFPSCLATGILSFTDKVISEKTRQYIKEVLGMTRVGRMLIDEGR